MDPISIIVFTIAGCCDTCCKIKKFIDETKNVEATLLGLHQDVTAFETILERLSVTLDEQAIKESAQSSGFIGNHWSHIRTSLRDANTLLCNLQHTFEEINKPASVLDAARKVVRINSTSKEFTRYRERIQSFYNVINVSMHSVTL
jgi:hypothetical protein